MSALPCPPLRLDGDGFLVCSSAQLTREMGSLSLFDGNLQGFILETMQLTFS